MFMLQYFYNTMVLADPSGVVSAKCQRAAIEARHYVGQGANKDGRRCTYCSRNRASD